MFRPRLCLDTRTPAWFLTGYGEALNPDGLTSWTSLFAPTEVTTTNETLFHRPTGARTNITYLPDGSRTDQVYSRPVTLRLCPLVSLR